MALLSHTFFCAKAIKSRLGPKLNFCTTTRYSETRMHSKAGVESEAHTAFSCDTYSRSTIAGIEYPRHYSFISLCIPFVAPENHDLAGIVLCVSLSDTYRSTARRPTTPGAALEIVRRPLSKEHALY